MTDLRIAVPRLRESVVAVLGLLMTKPQTVKKGKVLHAQFDCTWGSGFCVTQDKYVVTTHHIFNKGKPRNPATKFYVLTVPGNGDPFYFFPVVSFPVERPALDVAVLEVGACSNPAVHLAP